MSERVSELAAKLRPFLQSVITSSVSIAGGQVELQDSGGKSTWFDATDAGLTAALAAAGGGDAVRLPACAISGGPWTVAAGATMNGAGRASILTGNVSIGASGEVSFVRVVGAVTASGDNSRARGLWVSPGASETGITLSGDYSFAFQCYIDPTSATTSVGIAVTGAHATADGCLVDDATTTATVGAQVNGTDATIERCLILGVTGATLTNGSIIGSNLGGAGGAGLQVFTPGGRAENTIIGGTTDIVISSGALAVYGCQYDSITGVVTYEPGDRSSYSVEDYHAADIEAGVMTRHLPLAGNAGATLISTGSAWQSGALDLADADARTGILPAANGGTGVNNGAFALTIPATGTAALRDVANTFTAANVFSTTGISLTAQTSDAATNTLTETYQARHISSNAAVANFGVAFVLAGTNATPGTANRMARYGVQWSDAAATKARAFLSVYDGTTERIALYLAANAGGTADIGVGTNAFPSGGGGPVVAVKTVATTTPTGVAADSPIMFAKDLTNSSGTTAGQAALCMLDETTGYEYQFGRHARLPGGQQVAYVAKSANYTATDADYIILCTAGAGGITITLPAAANVPNQVYHIKKVDAAAGTVTIDANASETIDGALTQVIAAQWDSAQIFCNGTSWFVI